MLHKHKSIYRGYNIPFFFFIFLSFRNIKLIIMIVVLKEDVNPCHGMMNFIEAYDAFRYCFSNVQEVVKADGIVDMLSEDGWIGIKEEDVDEIIED